jgi:hypothetical protein
VLPELELRSRLEWTTVMAAERDGTRGFLAYQEAVFRPLGFPLSGSLRYALFDTDDFDSRVFAFENDLFAALSIPAYSGQGQRYYLNLSWRVNRWLRLESRYEETLLRRAVTGTGMAGRQREVKVQVRCKF